MRWSPGCNCCGGTAVHDCCTTGTSFPASVRVPESALLQEVCPLSSPNLANLTVEVNGHTAASCNVNGSYSVPNSYACLLPSIASVTSDCVWTGQYADVCNAGEPFFYPLAPHIMVVVNGGQVHGYVALHNSANFCNAGSDGFQYIGIARFATTGLTTPIDMTGPIDIPVDGTYPNWNSAVPLTVYF
jgi:hypothetical protein